MVCKCGFEAPEDFKFCPACGKRLPKPKPPEPVDERPTIKEVDPILKPVEAAKLLRISRWKLDELRIQGKLPGNCFFEIPGQSETKRMYRYRAKNLLAWTEHLQGPISTAG